MPESPEPQAPPPHFRPTDWRSRIFLGPNGIRAGWRAALYVTLTFLFLLFAQGLELLLGFHMPDKQALSGLLTPGVLFYQELLAAVTALAAASVFAAIERRRLGDYGLPLREAFGGHLWQGILWGLAQLSLLMLFIIALHGYSFGAIVLDRAALVRYGIEWAVVFLVVGLYEEFFFRGYVLFTLASGMGFWPAAVVTSAVFGGVHLLNPGEGPVGAAGVFFVGLFLCFTIRRTGSLWFAIGWHAAFDFGETFLYSVPNSGIVTAGQLSTASLQGPRWLTGGSVGPEGSVFDFLVMILAFVLFNWLYRPPRESDASNPSPQ